MAKCISLSHRGNFCLTVSMMNTNSRNDAQIFFFVHVHRWWAMKGLTRTCKHTNICASQSPSLEVVGCGRLHAVRRKRNFLFWNLIGVNLLHLLTKRKGSSHCHLVKNQAFSNITQLGKWNQQKFKYHFRGWCVRSCLMHGCGGHPVAPLIGTWCHVGR